MTLLTGESCVKYEWTEHQFRIEHTKGLVTRVTSSCIITNTFRIPPGNLKTTALIHIDQPGLLHWTAELVACKAGVYFVLRTIWTLRLTEFGRVKTLISRERLTVQNRGREGEERPPCPPLFNCLIAASSWWWPRSICSSGSHFC